ncbi:unnamed protein product, partial [Coregonus sp. 'balchen']
MQQHLWEGQICSDSRSNDCRGLSFAEGSEGMAARVDVDSGEVGQAGDAGVKPEPGPKPCLIPKPFSLQRNTTFRSILAPKTLTTTPQPSQTMPTTSSKPEPCQPISAPVSDSSSAVKLDRESTTIPELTNALEAPSAITPQTDSTHTTEQNQTALSTSLTTPTSEPPASTTSDPTGTSEANQVSLSELDEHGDSDTGHSTTGTEAVPSPSVTSTPLQPQSENTVSEPTPAVVRRHSGKDQAARWGGGRKRLSMELTSRFESAGLSLSSQPPAKQEWEQVTKRETAVPKVSVLRAKEEEKVTDSPGSSSDPEHSAPLKEERDGEGVKEEGVKKGSSIQRRISLLLDSSLKPEALTKREEVPCPMKQADSSVGVKQRIKDWAADTPPVQASNQRVDVAPQPFPVRVHPVLSVTGGSLATSKSVQLAPREDKASTLLRSGHFGIEDEEDEDEDEEEEEGEEEEVPLYKTVGRLLGQEDGGTQQELVVDQIGNEMEAKVKEEEKLAEVEKLKQLEVEERQAEERERERQKELENQKERERQNEEEDRKRKEEEWRERQREMEREMERQRQREEERDRERQRDEEERERKRKEEEKEQEKQIELEKERERQREEEKRERKRKEEEKERERLIELEKERERQREEEERERKRKEEEKERERLIELEREKERQREEEERERQREDNEREIKRKEEEEREKQIELEREKERRREEEERERKRKEEEEREKQIELEREKERQREEEETRGEKRKREEEKMKKRKERERQIELEREKETQREEERDRKEEEEKKDKRKWRGKGERQVTEGERGKLRVKDERQREEEQDKEEAEFPIQFITLKPDQPPKPEPPSPSTTVPIIEPIPKEEKQPHIEVVYDDFSVKEEKPLIKMVYDDFSVKPRRWGSQARLLADRAQVESPSPGTEEPGSLGPSENDLQRTVVDTQEPSQESPVSVEPHPAERDLEGGVPTPKDGTENEQEKEKKEEEKYKEEGTSVDTEE